MSEVRGKLLLTRTGGGAKTEIRPALRGEGWSVIDFEYDEDGKRKKTSERRNVSHEEDAELIKADSDFSQLMLEFARELL